MRLRLFAAFALAGPLVHLHSSIQPALATGYTVADTEAAITEASAHYGLGYQYLHGVVWCESRLEPYAVGSRGERGPVQILPGGGEEPRFYDAGYSDVWDPYQAVPFLAAELRLGRGGAWSCA
jgi:soluble lytic murein transglycosylase-like protein